MPRYRETNSLLPTPYVRPTSLACGTVAISLPNCLLQPNRLCKCFRRIEFSFLLALANEWAGTFAISMLNVYCTAWTREEVFLRRRPTRRIQNRLDTQLVMKKILLFRKPPDNSNGLVKDCSKNEMEQNETGTQNPAKPINSTVGFLVRMAKGVVSFLQNLLSPQTRKEGVRAEKVSPFANSFKRLVSARFTACSSLLCSWRLCRAQNHNHTGDRYNEIVL